jgi:hypothetical protein
MMMQVHDDTTARALRGGKSVAAGAMMLALAACVAPMPVPETDTGFIITLPAEVITLADPTQNLQAVRIMQDGCYWYEHAGPVETTMLPLRTPSGSPICTPRSS